MPSPSPRRATSCRCCRGPRCERLLIELDSLGVFLLRPFPSASPWCSHGGIGRARACADGQLGDRDGGRRGVFNTRMFLLSAWTTSMLSTPTPPRAMTLRFVPALMTSFVTFVAERTMMQSYAGWQRAGRLAQVSDGLRAGIGQDFRPVGEMPSVTRISWDLRDGESTSKILKTNETINPAARAVALRQPLRTLMVRQNPTNLVAPMKVLSSRERVLTAFAHQAPTAFRSTILPTRHRPPPEVPFWLRATMTRDCGALE